MVSFSCEVCNESMPKKKLMGHYGRCPQAVFTCIDCGKTFQGTSFQQHTQCVTEAEKYGHNKGVSKRQTPASKPQATPVAKPEDSSKETPKKDSAKKESTQEKKETKPKTESKKVSIKIEKKQSLKKLLKNLRKEHKLSKDDILAQLAVLPDGQLELEL